MLGTFIESEETNKLWKEMNLGTEVTPKELKHLLSVNLNETQADNFNAGFRNIKPLKNFIEVYDQTGLILETWE